MGIRSFLLQFCGVLLFSAAVNAAPGPDNESSLEQWGHSLHGKAWDEGPRGRPWHMEGIGHTHFPVTTRHPEVQTWFDQGHTLLHGFWYFEAERAFRWCAKLDPDCAMTYWGLARAAQNPDRQRAFLKEAVKRKATVSPRERDYIELWEAKLAEPDSEERRDSSKDFGALFDKLIMNYPEDLEAKALYWLERSGGRRYGSEAVLQEVLRLQPDHVGALHYRIHNWDGKDGRFAVDSCLALTRAAPRCGHLQHMPGHVLSGIGLWQEAAIAMDAATRVEKEYMQRQLILPEQNWNYVHNLDYLGYIQEQLGLYQAALTGAEQLLMAPHPMGEVADSVDQMKLPLVRLLLKYEKWHEILALTNHLDWDTNRLGQRALRLYAETRAHLGLGQLEEASEGLSTLKNLLKPGSTNALVSTNTYTGSGYVAETMKSLGEIMQLELRGLLELARTNWLDGIESLSRAARLQEGVWRKDPPLQPFYLYNVLGEAYLNSGSPRLAIQAFHKTLETVFNDGFALSGLVRAHAQSGERAEASQAMGRLLAVWSDADRPNRWLESALATGIGPGTTPAEPVQQRNYKHEVLDRLGPSLWVAPTAPELTAFAADGRKVSLCDFHGKNVVLIFYLGGECLHCMEQIQEAKKRVEAFKELNTEIIAVSKDSTEAIARSQKSAQITLLSDPSFESARRYQSYDDFEERELHSTVLITKEGQVHWAKHGGDPFKDFAFLEAELKRLNTPRSLLSSASEAAERKLAVTDFAAAGEAWWQYVQVLADDNMEGRDTGSAAYVRAAHFVADQFRNLGLEPAGTKDFMQPMDFSVRQIIEDKSSLELIRNGQTERLSLAEDANFGLPVDMAEQVEARAVFVGYGLVIPELGIDDLAGLDLKGKIAVMIMGGAPKSVPAPIQAHYSAMKQRWAALRKGGAVGVAGFLNPKSMDIPWARSTLARLQPSMTLADPELNDAPGLQLTIRINPAQADKFLAGSNHTVSELLELADKDKPLPKFELPVTIRAKVAARKSCVTSMNVAAILPGTDPNLKNEYVVLSAHLDHVGIGEPIHGDRIYNGAMDNAAGVACLLWTAHGLSASAQRPKRSVLFLAVTGEEKGLQGSKYFAHHPTVPKTAMVANVNVDMFLPLFPLKSVRVFGLDESSLGTQIRSVCAAMGLGIQPDPQPNRLLFIRSDQYNFILQGIPALTFKFGSEPNSPEAKLEKDWLTTRYHAPSDDLNQPLDKAAAGEFNQVVLRLIQRIANDPSRPTWKEESFFRPDALKSLSRSPSNPPAREPELAAQLFVDYMSWPGQAVAYKTGQRKILELRARAERHP